MRASVGHPLLPHDPSHIRDYELLGRLGGGGMGVVYAARTAGGPIVALKTLRHLDEASERDRQRFVREMRAASRLDSPHVAAVLAFQRDVEPPFLVTEFVDGLDVHENVTTHGPLAATAVVDLAVDVARGLVDLHATQVVHRDLTWRNVVLGGGGAVIVDLGIARWRDEPRLTMTGVAGSDGWLPPEAWDAPPVDARPGDVFQWGLLVAHAATGRHPFVPDDASGADPQAAILRGAPPTLEGLPVRLRGCVADALAADPTSRPTAAALVDRLTTLPAGAPRDLPDEPGRPNEPGRTAAGPPPPAAPTRPARAPAAPPDGPTPPPTAPTRPVGAPAVPAEDRTPPPAAPTRAVARPSAVEPIPTRTAPPTTRAMPRPDHMDPNRVDPTDTDGGHRSPPPPVADPEPGPRVVEVPWTPITVTLPAGRRRAHTDDADR